MIATLRGAFHITAFGWYAFVVNYLAAKDGEELPKGIFVYGGPWKYLTFLNLVSTFSGVNYRARSFLFYRRNWNIYFDFILAAANDVLWTGSSEWSPTRQEGKKCFEQMERPPFLCLCIPCRDGEKIIFSLQYKRIKAPYEIFYSSSMSNLSSVKEGGFLCSQEINNLFYSRGKSSISGQLLPILNNSC